MSEIHNILQTTSSQVQYIKACLHKTDSGSGSRRMWGLRRPNLRCRQPSEMVRRRPWLMLHKREEIAREWQDKNVSSLKKSWKFRPHLPCTGRFPKPARKTSARRPTTTFPARRPTHQLTGLHRSTYYNGKEESSIIPRVAVETG